MKEFLRALRILRQQPVFAALCIAPLALGIGASTAVFSLVNGIVLNPLPYRDSGRLVSIKTVLPVSMKDEMGSSVPLYLAVAKRSRDIAAIGIFRNGRVNFAGSGPPERAMSATVTASVFRTLEVRPALGRGFDAADEKPGAPRFAILSDRLWRRRFGSDPAALGRALRIDGQLYTIAGVMEPAFHFPRPETDLWLPETIDPSQAALGELNYACIARLAPGVTPRTAEKDFNALLRPLDRAFPEQTGTALVMARSGFAMRVHPLRDELVGDVSSTLWLLLGAVGFILLMACANVSGLLVVRGEARQRETAIRIALGARRRHLLGGALAEGLLFGFASCAMGLVLAWLGTRVLVRLAPTDLPRLEDVAIEPRVLGFSVALALAVSLMLGLLPARRLGRLPVEASLREGGAAASAARGKRGLQRLLVSVQVALALSVLVGAGLMARTYERLSHVALGFDPYQVIVMQLELPAADYPHDTAVLRFASRLVERLAGLPGVESAAATSTLPLGGIFSARDQLIEGLAIEPGMPAPVFETCFITPGYFKTMHIPLRAGRDLTSAEIEARRGVAIVDETLAKKLWPGGALGKRLHPNGSSAKDPWYTIVGVAGSVRARTAAEQPHATIYYPLLAKREDDWTPRDLSIVLRTSLPAAALQAAIRREVAAADRNLPVAALDDMQEWVHRDLAENAFAATMLLAALFVTLVLAGVGTYGFTTYVVSQRSQELGIRIAIGARAAHIVRTILGETAVMALAGIACGLLASLLLTRALSSLLYGVSPLDPSTFAVAAILILFLVSAASFLPAMRAARTEPLLSLKMTPGAAGPDAKPDR
jgi:putative ABC transport system permease protein